MWGQPYRGVKGLCNDEVDFLWDLLSWTTVCNKDTEISRERHASSSRTLRECLQLLRLEFHANPGGSLHAIWYRVFLVFPQQWHQFVCSKLSVEELEICDVTACIDEENPGSKITTQVHEPLKCNWSRSPLRIVQHYWDFEGIVLHLVPRSSSSLFAHSPWYYCPTTWTSRSMTKWGCLNEEFQISWRSFPSSSLEGCPTPPRKRSGLWEVCFSTSSNPDLLSVWTSNSEPLRRSPVEMQDKERRAWKTNLQLK